MLHTLPLEGRGEHIIKDDLSDLDIVEALNNGSDEAAEALVRRHGPWMLNVARRILRDDAAAADSVQEAFLSVFSKIGKFEGRSALKTWIHRIIVNKCLMMLRSRKRKAEEQLDEWMPQFHNNNCRIEEPWPKLLSADEIYEQKQLIEVVQDGINKLPEKYRIVLQLRDIEGFSTMEVAKLLELSDSNVKVRLHRGRSALKQILDPLLRGLLS